MNVVRSPFGASVAAAKAAGRLVVQPRMGFSEPDRMRAGLLATRAAAATTVGTVTIDSFTRMGHIDEVKGALASEIALNGYPIVTHPVVTTRAMLSGLDGPDFPVQVRHGSARPGAIVAAMLDCGLTATEGGPVSYCLPYGRVPLRESVDNWAAACRHLAGTRGADAHLETFGGCLMGQLCPPSLLVAVSVLEAMFFCRNGVTSVSLSYAQQTSEEQDLEALAALRRLAGDLLPGIDWHVVVYAYMGVYPHTRRGALALLERAAVLAVCSGSERLIVKTAAEAHRIPTIAENVEALEVAACAIAGDGPPGPADTGVYAEARSLIDAVVDVSADLGTALVTSFRRGYLDVPFCLHPDNLGRARSRLDADGRLRWSDVGAMPLDRVADTGGRPMASTDLLAALSYTQARFDA